ncbi:hypothetical protein [Anaerotruncus sp. 1XD42-93]|uniref:hypothetical protein n=1 Tax=Anaerotruncus sp. 1XD42-93 TaxID=2320853 RepID=UPI000EA16446|nr:hypothetical protein [Anaerotruncus sp. 1XD42-93]NBK17932.1 hypothetical protein [Anaerotruncus sp. 1XD42-93]RKJ93916.1 hypothetical protein D7Y41_13390 [Anaerotruncus sp. 1XD22-93]
MKKTARILGLALALTAALSAPVSAATLLTGDGFSNRANADYWQTDRYEPEGFDYANGKLYLSVGREGATSNRPADMQGNYYALQGRRMAVNKTPGAVWTAAAKIKIDESWVEGNPGRRRAEFRVDVYGGNSDVMPGMAVVTNGSGSLAVQYANPAIKSGWSTTSRYYDTKDQEYLSLELEEGWHTLLVKANDGLVYYYLDNLQIASVEFSESALTPAWLALNAQNYGTDYEVCFDSCYLYNGGYSVYKASQESRERAEDRKAERYQQKRDNWRERHTVYKFDGSDREYTREEAKQAGLDPDHAVSSRLDREMPDSYWNY